MTHICDVKLKSNACSLHDFFTDTIPKLELDEPHGFWSKSIVLFTDPPHNEWVPPENNGPLP